MPGMDRLNSVLRRVPAWPIYAIAAAYAAWRFWLAVTGQLGPDPVDRLTADSGTLALQMLIAGLTISVLRKTIGLNLLRYRRAIGLTAFFFAAAHFLVWLLLDLALRWDQILADLSKRPFVMIGMAALLLLLPLALTSNNMSLRRLGALRWRQLHWLTYPAVLLAALHHLIGEKVVTAAPVAYLAATVLLLVARPALMRRRS